MDYPYRWEDGEYVSTSTYYSDDDSRCAVTKQIVKKSVDTPLEKERQILRELKNQLASDEYDQRMIDEGQVRPPPNWTENREYWLEQLRQLRNQIEEQRAKIRQMKEKPHEIDYQNKIDFRNV